MRLPCCLLIALAPLACAQLEFDSDTKEIDVAPGATEAVAIYPFTNKGNTAIEISQVNPDCNCLAVEVHKGKLVYAPGESGIIRTKFTIGNKIGTESQSVGVWLKGDPREKPSITLRLTIHIPELVKINVKSLKWDVNGDRNPQSIHIIMNHDEPIHVTDVSSTSKDFSTKLVTQEEGKRYEIVITPLKNERPAFSLIRIDTDCTVEKQKVHQVYATIMKPEQEP